MEENTALYDEILKNGPSQTTLYIILARMKGEGRINEVIKWCTTFLRVYPKDIYLRMLFAECYLAIGSVGQAETEFLKVSSMMDDLLPVYAGLAGIYAKQKRFTEAAREAEMFLAHHPDDSEMREILKMVEEAKADAADGPDQEWPVLPDDEEGSLVNFATPTIAELYFSQGQLDAAVETYERVLEEHPHDNVSAERLAQLKAQLETDPASETEASGRVHTQERKVLAILEKWLPRVGEIKYG